MKVCPSEGLSEGGVCQGGSASLVEVCPRGVCQGGGASSGGGAQLKVYQKGWGSCQLGGGARVKVYQKGGVLPARWWRKGGVVYLKEVLTGGWVPGLEAFGGGGVGRRRSHFTYIRPVR